ncbi:tetratricopeptide repeat protein [Roseibacillus persicicus]|uniref:tetratricopeptide repeat protein n=1 Tax=Roseibacillus persicicus TaxID=454148 RepID=UPI00398AF05E
MKFILLAGLLMTTCPLLPGQEPPKPNEKAGRYHLLLLKRPDSGTLFDRFVDSWLDTGSKEDLETFLQASAEEGGAAEWRLLATYQDWMGREEQALQAMSAALEKSPDSGDLFFARAKMKARLLDFEGALADLEKGKAEAGEEAAVLRGTWLARAGRPEEALAAWKEILAARPDDEELREDLIELQVGEGLYEEAIATAHSLAEGTKDPYQRALRWMRLAAVEIMAGKREEGIATYRKVLEMTGEDSWLEKEVLAQVDKVFRRDEDIMGLREFYAGLREKFPQRVSLRKGLAAQMAANGEVEEAVALFREVLKITPGDVANREEFIALLENANRYDLAVEELNVILRDNENQPANWERMARLRDLMGDTKGLEEALEKVRSLRAVDGPGVVATAALFERYQMREKAEEILRKGHQDLPDSNEVTEALASFLASIDATEEEQSEATQMWIAMAKGADAEGLLRVSRALLAHRRAEACFTLLSQRIAEFPENLLLLKQLCDAGLASDQAKEAFPYALKLAELAQSPTDLASALTEVTRLSRRLDLEPVIQNLEKAESKTAVQWCVIAELRELQGDLLASDQALAEAAKVGDAPLILSQKVRLLEARDELEKAAEVMREIVALPGGERPVYLRKLVSLLADAGKWQEALAELENWKRVAPGDKAAWLRRAELLNESGELEEAVNELRRAVAKFGDEEELRSRLATALVEAGEYTEGERLYRKLYEEAEDATAKARWIERLASLAKQENRVDELLNEFERRKRRNSQEAGPLQALAAIHETLGDYEMQREALAEAVRRKPNNVKLRHQLASVEERAGDLDRATATLREAARLDSGPQSSQKLAELYFRNGEIELGLDILRSQQNGNPREIEATALALMEQAEWETAGNYLSESNSEDWRLQFLQAFTNYKLGEKEEARAQLVALCSVTEEIEGLSPLIKEELYKGWRQWLERAGMQQDIRETTLMNAMQQFSSIFFRMGNRQSSYRMRRGRSSQARQTLPGTAEEMRFLALATLYLDATRFSVKNRDELLDAIPFPNSTFGNRLKNSHRLSSWTKEEFEAGRISLGEMVRIAGADEKFEVKFLEQAAKELKATDPNTADLALTFLLQRRPENGGELLLKKLELLEELEDEQRSNRLNQIASLVLGNEQSQYDYYGETPEIGTALKERNAVREFLRKELASWPVGQRQKDESENLANAVWFNSLIADAWNSGRAAEFVDLANRMFKEQAATINPAKSGMVYYQGRYYPTSVLNGQQDKLFQPPAFPRIGPEMPQTVYQLLQAPRQTTGLQVAADNSNTFFKKWSAAHQQKSGDVAEDNNTEKEMTPELLMSEVPRLESPQMRVLAWRWMGEDDKLAEELKAFEESTNATDILTTAGYWFQKEDLQKSYQLLAKARHLPMDKTERNQVDGQLAMVGSILAQQGTALDELEVARRAILRLRRSARSTEEENELVGPMNALGLSEVVAQMQAARLRKGSSSTNSTRRQLGRGVSPRLSRALTEGNIDAAAREGLRLLRPLLRGSNNSWEIREMVERYRAANLIDPILKLAHPGETRSYSRRMEYVSLCEQLGEKDLAKPILIALADERPDDTVVTAKLLQHLPADQILTKAKALMKMETLDDFGLLVGEISKNEGDDPFESEVEDMESAQRALQGIDLTTEFLNTVSPDGEAAHNLTWVVQVLIKSVQEWGLDDEALSPSFEEAFERKGDFEKKRLQSTRNILLAALSHPQTAAQAFYLMEGHRKGLSWTEEELLESAFTALQAVKMWKEDSTDPRTQYVRNNLWTFVSQNSYQDSDPELSGQMPGEYLASHILLREPDAAAEDFAALEKLDPTQARVIGWIRQMTDPDPAVAEKAVTEWKSQLDSAGTERTRQYGKFLQLATIAKVPQERMMPLEKEFFQAIRETALRSYEEFPSLAKLIRTRAEQEGTEGGVALLESFLAETVGPRELWDEWARLSNQDVLDGQLEILAYTIQSVGEDIFEDPGSFATLRATLKFSPLIVNNSYEIGEGFTRVLRCPTVASAEKKLEEIDFWNLSWAELGAPVDLDEEGPLWAHVLEAVLDYELRSDLGKKLSQATGDRRFRQRMVGALITEKTGLLANELEGVAEKLMQLPPEEREGLATILRMPYPDLSIPGAKPKSKKLLALLGQEKKEDVLANARKRMETGFQGAMHDYTLRQEIFSQVNKLIPIDSQFAAEYFAAALTEEKPQTNNRFQRRSVFYSGGSSRATREDDLFHELQEEASDQGLSLQHWSRFLDAFDRLPDGPPLSVGHGVHYDLSEFASKFWSSHPKPKNLQGIEKKIFKGFHWDNAIRALEGESESVRNTAYWLVWLNASNNWKIGNLGQDHLTWMESSKLAERDQVAYNCFSTLIAIRDWNGIKPESREKVRAAWSQALSNPAHTVRLRMELACTALTVEPRIAESPECITAITQLLEDYLAEERSLHATPIRKLFIGISKLSTPLPRERWNSLVEESSKAFLQLASRPNRNFSNDDKGDFARAIMLLCLKVESFSSAKNLLSLARESLRGDLELIVQLVAADQPALAKQLFTTAGNLYEKPADRQWNAELAATVDKLLPLVANEQERYRIHCVLASLPNGKGDVETTVTTRLVALAKEFETKAPKTPQSRLQCLAALAKTSKTTPILKQEFQELSQRYLHTQTVQQSRMPGDISAENLQYIFRRYFWDTARAGDLTPLDRHIKAFAVSISTEEYAYQTEREAATVLRDIISSFCQGLEENPDTPLSPEVFEIAKGWYRAFAKVKAENSLVTIRAVAVPFNLHALGGKSEEFDKWVRTLPKDEQQPYLQQLKQPHKMATNWSTSSWWTKSASSDVRKFYFRKILDDHFASRTLFKGHLSTREVAREKTMTEKEEIEIFGNPPADHPQRNQFRFEMGIALARYRKGQQQNGITMLNETLQEMTEAGDPQEHFCRAELASIYGQRAKNLPQAIKLADQVDWDKVPKNRRDAIRKQIDEFRKKRQNAPKPKKEQPASNKK